MAVALRWRPSTRQPEVSRSSRWARTGGSRQGRIATHRTRTSRLAPPLGPRCTGSPAGLVDHQHQPRRDGGTRRLNFIGGQLGNIDAFVVTFASWREKTANTHPQHERYHSGTTQTELVAAAVPAALKRTSSSLGTAVGRSRHQAQARPRHAR